MVPPGQLVGKTRSTGKVVEDCQLSTRSRLANGLGPLPEFTVSSGVLLGVQTVYSLSVNWPSPPNDAVGVVATVPVGNSMLGAVKAVAEAKPGSCAQVVGTGVAVGGGVGDAPTTGPLQAATRANTGMRR